ncbi:MAG TPA: guanitoxin biosynthesis heme-dependent pre-guanitoxin N-hydroxylase GntA, partial [Prolixibacteraceae bacterium]|nr:guanitoxin biosynthesis heme-dependent pre-guanitoxin N-hydroxylase GntA [Prolixibacteraceae bacterium]
DDQPWDETVSADCTDDNFSFSVLNHAFYIIGLHPNSSRKARRSPYPAMVFNLHWQFEQLREMGTYKQVKETIRQRDIEFEGSINPMLDDFGDRSEARQYSGRAVDDSWKCPFHHK